MRAYVFDSFAILALLRNERGSDRVEQLLDEVRNGRAQGYVSVINLAELFYIISRRKSNEEALVVVESLKSWGLRVVEVSERLALAAGAVKTRHTMSLADAFCVASAITVKAAVVTGDKEMRPVADVELVWIEEYCPGAQTPVTRIRRRPQRAPSPNHKLTMVFSSTSSHPRSHTAYRQLAGQCRRCD